jgi:hypothetical protein
MLSFQYQAYNIFILLSRNGHQKFMYEGENNKNGLIDFMKNPSKPPEKPKEEDWSTVKSDVVHLTSDNFDTVIMVCISFIFLNPLKHIGYCITTCFKMKETAFCPHSLFMGFCMTKNKQ